MTTINDTENVIDLFRLSNKTALVTGGAKGLGTAINEGLLEAGVSTLVFCGRGKHGSLEDEEGRLKGIFPNRKIIGIQCDISNELSIEQMVEQIKGTTDQIDILVNNAGVTWAAPSIDQTPKSWHRVLDINLTGTFLVTRDIAREFMIPKVQGSSIINISSVLAIQGNAEAPQIGYTASKSALLGLTRQLAIEWSIHKIRVNAIMPSFVEGLDSMAKVFTTDGSPIRETLLDIIPLNRFVQSNDLKAVVCFLASNASSYITGQQIALDGGLSVKG